MVLPPNMLRPPLNHTLLAVAIDLTSLALLCTLCSPTVTIYSTNPAHPILVTILPLPPMRTTLAPLFGYQLPPPAPNIMALLGTERCTITINYSLNFALSTSATIPPLLPTRTTLPSLLDSKHPSPAPNFFQPSPTQPHSPPSPNIARLHVTAVILNIME
jgi:hypothetical protein